jgi:hypothetical protein
MTTTVPVPCPEAGCMGIVHVPKSLYDDHDVLVGLTCPHGHRFDYEKKPPQRIGIERLIQAGDLPTAAGPAMVPIPTPTNPTPALTISEGRCGNSGEWCAEGYVTALPGWRRNLCDSCYQVWRSMVLGI